MATENPTTRAALEAALDQSPADWDLRLVYADFLEDLGETVLARGQRWIAANETCPFSRELVRWLQVGGNKSGKRVGIRIDDGEALETPLSVTRRDAERALAETLDRRNDK